MLFSRFTEDGSTAQDGGKGCNLKFLTRNGLNVPEGIVLGASFYSGHYPKPPSFKYEDSHLLEKQCVQMRKSIINMEFPEHLSHDLSRFLSEFNEKSSFAVRSSSTFEDLSSAAFAGQHDTFLNVLRKDVEVKVKECLASLWQPHAVLYRNHQGFSQEDASMAVVIQRMIKGTSVGVAFSADPVSGNLFNVLIEANFGIGESVVGGETQTDSWVVNSERWEIIERRVKEKDYALMAADSGLKRKELVGDERTSPCLNDTQIIEVAQKARMLMDLYSSPQDIEWVYDSEQLYLVQARPQTTIPPKFTRDESAERFPEALTPLTWSYVREAFNNSLEYSLEIMNIQLPTRPWFELKDYYVYGNQNAVKLLALYKPVKAKSFEELVDELPVLREKYRWVKELPQIWMRDLDKYLIRIGKLSDRKLEDCEFPEVKEYLRELFSLSNDYFKPNIAISMTQAFLTKTLFGIIRLMTRDDMKANDIFKSIISVSETKTGQINREIFDLSMVVRKNIKLSEILSKGGSSALNELGCFVEFSKMFHLFLDNYGHREVSFDFYNPTWIEAPGVVLDLIYLASTAEKLTDPRIKERELKLMQLAATQKLYDQTPSEIHFFLHELIRLTLNFTFLDDLEHFQTTRINLLARKAIGSIGRRIKRDLAIEDSYDLFFLTKDEIERMSSFKLSDEMITLIKIRKAEFKQACANEPRWEFGVSEDSFNLESTGEGVMKGTPGSPGEFEGEVYLVHGAEDFSGMPNGAVLVAKTTNPAWTPLFYKAKALITESGGPLSHGAVTARELGLPAVMGVRNCLKQLKNGDRVSLNGQQGIVIKK